MLVHLFPKLNVRRRDTGSFRQSTHKPLGAVCVAGLAVNQNREHPLGCKSSKLLVELLSLQYKHQHPWITGTNVVIFLDY